MEVPEYLYAKLVQAGMTKAGACAVLGNVQHESAFKPENVEDRSGISDAEYVRQVDSGMRNRQQFMGDTFGFGLAQWTYPPRKGWMWDWFKERGKSIADLETQVEFLIWEMKTHYSSCWNQCTTSDDLYACTKKLLWEWENPYDKEGQMGVRYSAAQQWYSKLSGLDVGEVQVPDGGSAVTVMHPAPTAELDDDGLPIQKTFPPRTIDRNCKDFKEIKLLQVLLWCHGYNVVIDGVFGDSLDKKLRQFQKDLNLLVDGVCGPNTWRALGIKM